MIISRCPLRVSIAGGSTDLQEFIDYKGRGSVISFPCNLYSYVTLFTDKNGYNAVDDKYIIKYSQKEEVSSVSEIHNDIARECLDRFKLPPTSISFFSDIFSHGSGLASSSAYLIALIKAASLQNQLNLSQGQICEIALELERNFNPLTGYQDSYGCGIGGFKKLDFYPNNKIRCKIFGKSFIEDYNKYLVYTGVSRKSTDILKTLDLKKVEALLPLVQKMEKSITRNKPDDFFEIINEGWARKKETSNSIASNQKILEIDEKLDKLSQVKAHKLCGAGGGGYFLVFTDKNYDLKQEEDLNKITFKIACDWYGASATEL
tara:strand:+ start:25985 stop:26941 length:957 start_codon:yes stop_codon:yes gene_type:complete